MLNIPKYITLRLQFILRKPICKETTQARVKQIPD